VYSNELLAKLYYLDGDRGQAQQRLKVARESRVAANMFVTPMEAGVIAAVR
jgi:hypothetical protein